MKRNKPISGRYVAPGRIKITKEDEKRLASGQRVLIYQPTDKEITDYSTGKRIGRKERVLGAGVVKVAEGKAVVVTNQVPVLNTGLSKLDLYRLANRTMINKKNTLKLKKVLIKPIEE